MSADLVVVGAGSLSRAVIQSLAHSASDGLRVLVVSRPSERLEWIRTCAAATARAARRRIEIRTRTTGWGADLVRTMRATRPRVVFHAASLQSPWQLGGDDRWSRLVRSAGYGLTLPLHAVLARRVALAAAEAGAGCTLVNACYPDVVNAMLNPVAPVACGAGNVAILASCLEQPDDAGGRLRLVAHHSHVAATIAGTLRGRTDFGAWMGDRSARTRVGRRLERLRLPADERLNTLTGATAAAALLALLGHAPPLRGHAPGVHGLPGGYPVVMERGSVRLDLPAGVSVSSAAELNVRATRGDGLILLPDGSIRPTPRATRALRKSLRDPGVLLEPLEAREADRRARILLQLRDELGGRG